MKSKRTLNSSYVFSTSKKQEIQDRSRIFSTAKKCNKTVDYILPTTEIISLKEKQLLQQNQSSRKESNFSAITAKPQFKVGKRRAGLSYYEDRHKYAKLIIEQKSSFIPEWMKQREDFTSIYYKEHLNIRLTIPKMCMNDEVQIILKKIQNKISDQIRKSIECLTMWKDEFLDALAEKFKTQVFVQGELSNTFCLILNYVDIQSLQYKLRCRFLWFDI